MVGSVVRLHKGYSYIFHLLEDVSLTLNLSLQLLWTMYKFLLKLDLEVVFPLLSDNKGAVDLGDDIGLILGELYFLSVMDDTMVLA